jgi:hypothetical protein
MSLAIQKIVDISLELDDSKFSTRTPLGFKKDLQFRLEVLKEHDAAEGAGQVVRGVHMRLRGALPRPPPGGFGAAGGPRSGSAPGRRFLCFRRGHPVAEPIGDHTCDLHTIFL